LIHAIVGAFWGDEGKGKVSDYFCLGGKAVAARFQGGPNAGHTIFVGDAQITTRIVPSGIINAKAGLIGAGVALNPRILVDEMQRLEEVSPGVGRKLRIASTAHLITPEHVRADTGATSQKIGTTRMGVGPCYTDKYRRTGLRVEDILGGAYRRVGDAEFSRACEQLGELYSGQIVDSSEYVNGLLEAGERVVAEGAQGTLLDIDHGDYPFVTSSNTFSGAVCTGLGVGPSKVTRVSLVVPVYMSKVGNGTFETKVGESDALPQVMKVVELDGATGKQRAYGWLDMAALRKSLRINGAIILTRTDLAASLPRLSVKDGDESFDFEPWQMDAERPEKMPKGLLEFAAFVARRSGVPVSGLSYGRRTQEFFEL
jgi:adenylosuccinate synthase